MNAKFFIIKYAFLIGLLPLSITKGFNQNEAHNYLRNIAQAYADAKVLAFDGNIKYYTGITNTSPEETTLVSYRRDGSKVHIVIGDQIVVYDGSLNIIINEDQKVIFLSTKKVSGKKDILPTSSFEDYINSGQFSINASDYLGNKRKMSITSTKKTSASTLEFIYQPNTNFIEFSRMIIDSENENIDEDLNKKKLEFSYYNYKTTLAEKIDTSKFVTKVKSGNKTAYKGVGRFKDFEVRII